MASCATDRQCRTSYAQARERYAALGVDTERVLEVLARFPISLHCWQGDDVAGFESQSLGSEQSLGGGLATTGNYPGKARNAGELRRDLDKAYSLIPGSHRLNLHAIYAETRGLKVERNELLPEHFTGWVDWAKANGRGIDFNPTCFSHPMSDAGFTLASRDEGIRRFWIEHCVSCRRIGEHFGRELGTPCVTNIWIPDGFKDTPVDRLTPRRLLKESLDTIFAEELDPSCVLDSVEGKLFGLGSESYVVGSHEFYLGYAVARVASGSHVPWLCLDSGHFHPTEVISDKLSSILLFLDGLLLHVSRGVRWDSDHIVTQTDELLGIMQAIVRGGFLGRVRIGLDFFDASVNRVAAWVIGARSALRTLLVAMLEPINTLLGLEVAGDYTSRLALLEEVKGLPYGSVWDFFCLERGVPVGVSFMDEIRAYERQELSKRD